MDTQGIGRRKALALVGGSVLAAAIAPVARAKDPLVLGIQATTWGAMGFDPEMGTN